MKKIILTLLMVIMLFSVLAFSAFADDSIIVSKTVDDTYGTIIELSQDPGLDNAKQYVSELKKINDAGTDKDALCILTDGTNYYVFPSSYIVNETADGTFDLTASDLATAVDEFNAAKGTSYYAGYSIVNGSAAAKRLEAVARFEFTSDVTKVSDSVCCLRSYPYLVEARFKYAINLSAGDLFRDSKALKNVVGYEKATKMGNSAFMGCTALESVCLPVDTTKIPSKAFWGCKKITITNLAELTQLTTIGSSAFQDTSYLNFVLPDTVTTIESNAFQSAFKEGNGGSFTIGKNSKLTTIGSSAFEDCRKFPTSVYIPSTVTSIGQNAFLKCYTLQTLENFENCKITTIENGTFSYVTNLKSIKIPETVTTIGTAFADNNYLTLVYIPKSVTTIADTFTGGKPTTALFIYTGNDASVLSTCSKIAGGKVIQAADYDENGAYSGINLVVGYSHCVAYKGGVHGNTVMGSYAFTSYYAPIVISNECDDCGMEAPDTYINALFACLGYSSPMDDRGELTIGFTVDKDAIAEFEALTGKTVSYGVFAVLKDRIGNEDIFADGAPLSETIVAELTNHSIVAFELRLLGFEGELRDIELAMGAYVYDSKGDEYTYLQFESADEGCKYHFSSYNEILG